MHDEPIDFELLLMAVERCFACQDTCTSECRFYKSKHYLNNHTAMGINMELYADSFPRGDING